MTYAAVLVPLDVSSAGALTGAVGRLGVRRRRVGGGRRGDLHGRVRCLGLRAEVLHLTAALGGRVAGDGTDEPVLDAKFAGAARTSVLVASGATTAHSAVGSGGVVPSAESAGGRSRSRGRPASAGLGRVDAQIFSEGQVARGKRTSFTSATANRQPSTEPSLGTIWSDPFWAKAHWPSVSW